MASQSTGGPPGAQGNSPETVFCHACGNQWTKDARGLDCPSCNSGATEIITPDSNVREFYEGAESPAADIPPRPRRMQADDSDPDEADIEEHLGGGYGQNPYFQRTNRPEFGGPNPGQWGPRPDVNDGSQVLDHFYQMLSTFGGLPRGPPVPPHPDPHDHHQEQQHAQGWGQPQQPGGNAGDTPGGGRGPNIRTYTSRDGNSYTSFTIATGPIRLSGGARRVGGPPGAGQGQDDFNTYVLRPRIQRTPWGTRITMISIRAPANESPSMFGDIMNGPGSPPGAAGARVPGQPVNLAATLGQLLSLLTPGNGQYGDAVYTQEALDRIVSSMMEQNPQSNAAPPASEDAINKLEKKTVDESMLGPEGKAECTICIEELNKGDIVVYLPCKHWFHEECANMWLREHNTCPICRSPIEENSSNLRGGARPDAGPDHGAPQGPGSPGAGFQEDFAPPPFPPPGHGGPSPAGGSTWAPPPPHPSTRPAATSRSWRWSFSFPPRPAPAQPQSSSRNGGRMPSGYNINLPTTQSRRNSQSPPATATGSRARQRSPTPSSWDRARGHEEPEQQQQQQQGSGPLSWLRSQLSRASNSGPDGAGDRPQEPRRE